MARVTESVTARICYSGDLAILTAKVQEKVQHLTENGVRQIATSARMDTYGVLYIDIEGVL